MLAGRQLILCDWNGSVEPFPAHRCYTAAVRFIGARVDRTAMVERTPQRRHARATPKVTRTPCAPRSCRDRHMLPSDAQRMKLRSLCVLSWSIHCHLIRSKVIARMELGG